MTQEKPESRNWLDDLALVTAQQKKTPDASQGELATTLDLNRPYVTNLLSLEPLFDPQTVAKVRQAAPGYNLPFSGAKELLALKGKVDDFPKAGRKALDEILAKRLLATQIKDLVNQMAGGKRAPEGKPAPRGESAPGGESTSGFFEGLGRSLDKAIARPSKTALALAAGLLLLAFGILWAVLHSGRVLDWVHPERPTVQTAPTTVAAVPAPPAQVKPPIQHSSKAVKASGTAAKVSTQKPAASAIQAAPAVPSALLIADTTFVTTFVHDLYNVTHRNIEERRDTLQSLVSDDYGKDFTGIFFSKDRIDNFHMLNLIETFTFLQPVVMTMVYGKTEDFSVKGTSVTREEDNYSKPQTQAISYLVTIAHDAGGEPKVVDITDVNAK